MKRGLLVSFDFSTAFPTLPRAFVEAVLQIIQIPPFRVRFILASLLAPKHFCVGKGVVMEVLFTPVLVSFCASFVFFNFKTPSSAFLYMYMDDLCIIIASKFCETLRSVMRCMTVFGRFSGLQVNLGKSAVVTKGSLQQSDLQAINVSEVPMKLFVRYLRVLIGTCHCCPSRLQSSGGSSTKGLPNASFSLPLTERMQLQKFGSYMSFF